MYHILQLKTLFFQPFFDTSLLGETGGGGAMHGVSPKGGYQGVPLSFLALVWSSLGPPFLLVGNIDAY